MRLLRIGIVFAGLAAERARIGPESPDTEMAGVTARNKKQ